MSDANYGGGVSVFHRAEGPDCDCNCDGGASTLPTGATGPPDVVTPPPMRLKPHKARGALKALGWFGWLVQQRDPGLMA